MKRARVFEKMPTDMEMAEAVMETSLWLQVLLPGFTSDLQPASELPLAVMAAVGSGGEGSQVWVNTNEF